MTEPAKKAPAKKAAAAPTAPMIRDSQMRHIHGLLRSRLGLHERADVLEYLSFVLDRDVPSRTTLSADEAHTVILRLEALAPMAPTHDDFAALRAAFPAEQIGKLPRSTCKECSNAQFKRCERHQWITKCPECNNNHSSATMHIDFVGHADVTARLLAVDPMWTWEPMGTDQFGVPASDRNGDLWIRLTVLGVTRIGVGDSSNGKGNKERIGDAIRNAAMRFGVALDLWAKGDREWAHTEKDDIDPPMDPAPPVERTPEEATATEQITTEVMLRRLDAAAESQGMDRETITAKWRAAHGNIDVATLAILSADDLTPLVLGIEDYLRSNMAG